MAEVMAKHYANPSSLHRGGVEARKLLERARQLIAGLFQTDAAEWFFTTGGTEGNNAAIIGAAHQYRSRGNHLITTEVEHSSVYETFTRLELEGFRVTRLPVGRNGHVDPAAVSDALTDDTILVSMMHVNNEMGAVQPVAEVGRLLSERHTTLFHVDGVQSVGKLPIKLREWGIDLFTASAHKIGGPRGVGLLYKRSGIELQALLTGGGQEEGLRPGTENTAAIVAAAKAFRLAVEGQDARCHKMYKLREKLLQFIAKMPELQLNGAVYSEAEAAGQNAVMAPHIVNISYPGMKPEIIIHTLEELQVLVSTKSACSSKEDKPSRVLTAMGLGGERAATGIRISFGDEHDERSIESLCQALQTAVRKLKPLERKG